MALLGKKNRLLVVKQVDFGFYLDGGDLGEVLLPVRYVPAGLEVDHEIEVFIYLDSEDRPIATTEEPYVQVGQCAHLKVVSKGNFGSFLDWGLPKDLLVPFKEQRIPMQEGKSYTVFVFIDATDRIAASSKLSFHLEEENDGCFVEGQQVRLHIASRSDMGYKAVVENTHLGLIHNSDLLQPVKVGEVVDGYIKTIREDGKIDLSLQASGRKAIGSLSDTILEFIAAEGGHTDLTDKSSPEDIYKVFQVSKKHYKKALGKLYKEKRIVIEKNVVRLASVGL